MSQGGQAYAVDLDQLRAAFGSRDERLLDGIVTLTDEMLDEEEAGSVTYSPRDALVDIIAGECRAPKQRRHLYGHAIEDLCQHFGEVIPIPDDSDEDEVGDPDDLEIETKLSGGELPIPVPAWEDTPYVRFLTATGVREELERLSGEDLSHEDSSIEEGRRILLHQLKWASDRGKGFVVVING